MSTATKNRENVNQQELEDKVKTMYKNVALHPEVSYHFEMGRALAERLGYPSNVLDAIPGEAIDSFAGVGYYFDFAQLEKGESVLDLGSGSGMDSFYAALKIGESGQVTGVDMTQEQLDKAIQLAKKADFSQAVFREGYIESVPMESNSVDVVISNGVINLSSEKSRVFLEASRVLKPGGRLVLADIVSEVKLPQSITCNASLWAACIGGAIQRTTYLEHIEAAGMKVKKVKENPYAFKSKSALGATDQYGIKSISILAVKE